jgi:hypothetical protein
MVFLLQHSQNRGAIAKQLKLDALINVSEPASGGFIELVDLRKGADDQFMVCPHARGRTLAGKENGPSGPKRGVRRNQAQRVQSFALCRRVQTNN